MAETGLEVVISMNLQDVDSKTIQVVTLATKEETSRGVAMRVF